MNKRAAVVGLVLVALIATFWQFLRAEPSIPDRYLLEVERFNVPLAASWVAADGTVYGGIDTGLHTTRDGRTWEPVKSFPSMPGHLRTVFVDSRGTIFTSAMGDGRLLSSFDRGVTWQSSLEFSAKHCVAWRVSEDAKGILYVGEYTNREDASQVRPPRVFKSSDGGRSWEAKFEVPTSRHVHFVAADPYHPGVVYASFGDAEGGALYRSDDYGEHWSLLGAGGASWQPTSIIFAGDHRFLGTDDTSGEVYRTDNDRDFRVVFSNQISREWFWGIVTRHGMFFGSVPGSAEARASIIASFDGGNEWMDIIDFGEAPVWSGAAYASNEAPDGWIYSGDGGPVNALRFRIIERTATR